LVIYHPLSNVKMMAVRLLRLPREAQVKITRKVDLTLILVLPIVPPVHLLPLTRFKV